MDVLALFAEEDDTPKPKLPANVATDLDAFGEALKLFLHPGMLNARTSVYLAEKLGMPQERSGASTRQMIQRLIVERDCPIGSCRDGYFFINNAYELEAVEKELQGLIRSTKARIQGLRRGWATRKRWV